MDKVILNFAYIYAQLCVHIYCLQREKKTIVLIHFDYFNGILFAFTRCVRL